MSEILDIQLAKLNFKSNIGIVLIGIAISVYGIGFAFIFTLASLNLFVKPLTTDIYILGWIAAIILLLGIILSIDSWYLFKTLENRYKRK